MNRQVLVEHLRRDEVAWLDTTTGRTTSTVVPAGTRHRGNVTRVAGHTFALYADAGVLYFQWDERRWPFSPDGAPLMYVHDLDKKTTTFSVDGKSVEYPAWWRDDPLFDPLVPERDQEEDDLGYYAALQENIDLQEAMLKAWGGNG